MCIYSSWKQFKKMRSIIIILFLGVFSKSFAQVAIIDDKDGYTNVRSEPNAKSEILYKIKTNQVFWFGQEDYFSENVKWIQIEIPKNKYSLECGSLYNLVGYIHKSKIKPLNTINEYIGTDISFEYETKTFSEENKIIDYSNNWITAINGLHPWGTDGEKPKMEVEELNIKINGSKVYVPEILISDIYECDNNFSIYKVGQTFFVHQWNGDAAGAYEIVWVLTTNGITQRLVGTLR